VAILISGVYRQVWRYIGAPDIRRLVFAVGLTLLLYFPLSAVLQVTLALPLSSLFFAVIVWSGALISGRMVARWRSTGFPMHIFKKVPAKCQPILLLGDQESWLDVLRRLFNNTDQTKVRVLGLIELQREEGGRSVRGIPILGDLSELGDIIDIVRLRHGETPWVALTGKAKEPPLVQRALTIAAEHGAEIMVLGHNESAQTLEPVRASDLVKRPAGTQHDELPPKFFRGANVLITGGGGSVGTALAFELARHRPALLTIIDASEFNLYTVEWGLRKEFPDLSIHCRVGDVRDSFFVNAIFSSTHPEVVFHAAALKNVPLLQRHPCEAVLTNLVGTQNVARAAVSAGASRMILVSSDNAVNPANVAGASRRLGEIAMQKILSQSSTLGIIARIGNALSPTTAVVSVFEQQIARGGPVTVTAMDSTRRYMAIEDAAELIVKASTHHSTTERTVTYSLGIGEVLSVRQLAENIIRLKGKVPYSDIPIISIGLREGEKLHADLCDDKETLTPTDIVGLMRCNPKVADDPEISCLINEVSQAAKQHDTKNVTCLLDHFLNEQKSIQKSTQKAEVFLVTDGHLHHSSVSRAVP
jgi:O-antigen biosynthesis protein WbqV